MTQAEEQLIKVTLECWAGTVEVGEVWKACAYLSAERDAFWYLTCDGYTPHKFKHKRRAEEFKASIERNYPDKHPIISNQYPTTTPFDCTGPSFD